MRRMGIDQHHTLSVLRDNVRAMKMRNSKAQWGHIAPLMRHVLRRGSEGHTRADSAPVRSRGRKHGR